jgi:hypothetical protein
MNSIIDIKFPNNVNSDVYVYKDGKMILLMKRKFLFGSKVIAEIYENNKMVVKSSNFMCNLKIIDQNLENKIEIKRSNIFITKFQIAGNKIEIKENLLYFINTKMSKIYWNSKNVGQVKIKKILDFNGINLEINLNQNLKGKEFEIIISFLLTTLHLNI